MQCLRHLEVITRFFRNDKISITIKVIKTQIPNLVRATRFWNNRLQGTQSRKIGKPNNFKFWEQVNQRV